MTALNKHALREELEICSKDRMRKIALAMLDELETKEEQRANWFQMAQKLGDDLESAEKRIAELEANKGKPVMFIDGDISASDAEKLAEVIREMGRRTSDCSKARTVTLPDVEKWRSVDAVRAQNAYKVLVSKVLAAAGIGVKGE
ncbi:hypothetical protein [Citrobacter sp. Cf132]|uniref:hypothetical protein n=1 Tax=Citrobacter sp. Cf132 TaxID=2985077 RepID=UPI0025767B51|nr:hypothetical protein [Citrobacter sp. Cf132]MDM3106679.1 hypothetical protein [Citrobacter sp. Cf132]MDU4235322.1 hypothetical protein [Citrobacter freundii]